MKMNDIPLPQRSIEAEQSVIGGLLLDNNAWDRIADILTEADFYQDDHRRIFAAIRRLVETGKPADVVTVFEALEATNQVEQTGGLAYLGEIASATPSAANIRRYAEIVADKAMRRRLAQTAAEIADLANKPGAARDLIDEAQGQLIALADTGPARSEPRGIGDILHRAIEQIEKNAESKGGIVGLPTGFADLDRKTSGLHSGDLVIVAGRPAMGKTCLALNIAEHSALAGRSVLVFSLEMADEQLAQRSIASIGGIPLQRLRSGQLQDPEDYARMAVALGKLHESKLVIDETPSLTASQMAARARRIKRRQGLDLVVIDYLQLMRGDGNTRNEELGAITRTLKLMAKELKVPVILLSQLSRKVEERTNKRPMMSDLRESGAIEQDADLILMLYRDEYYNEGSEWRGYAEAIIAKQRMGETGSFHMVFDGEYSRFRNADQASVRAIATRQQQPTATRRRSAAYVDD